jgi:hypothetical protein
MGRVLGSCMAASIVAVIAACSTHAAPTRKTVRPRAGAGAAKVFYRPEWVASVAADASALARCLEGRESPASVVHVHHTADAVTVVTTVDAYEALEVCAVANGKVLVREPSAERLRSFDGLPVFILGARKPRLPTGARMQEIVKGGEVLGWLYWPAERPIDGDEAEPDLDEGSKGNES